jgi:hypothetical protein
VFYLLEYSFYLVLAFLLGFAPRLHKVDTLGVGLYLLEASFYLVLASLLGFAPRLHKGGNAPPLNPHQCGNGPHWTARLRGSDSP